MTCEKCGDKGYVIRTEGNYERLSPCACQNEARILRNLELAGIPPRFRGFTLLKKGKGNRLPFKPMAGITKTGLGRSEHESYEDGVSSQLDCWKIFRTLLESYLRVLRDGKPGDVSGRLICGTCGVGKTHLAATLLTDLVYEGLSDVRFISYPDLIRRIRFSYGGSGETEAGILTPLSASKVLVLDDLGAEASENIQWVQSVLGNLLDQRYQAQRPTVVTTNFPDATPEEKSGRHGSRELTLVDRIGVRLRSRLKEMCPLLPMKGLDLRDHLVGLKPRR